MMMFRGVHLVVDRMKYCNPADVSWLQCLGSFFQSNLILSLLFASVQTMCSKEFVIPSYKCKDYPV